MTKKLLTILIVFIAILTLPLVSSAVSATGSSPSTMSVEQLTTLNRLYTEIVALQTKLNELKAQAMGLRSEFRLTKQLVKGTNDQEVKILQEVLATDPEIYPEGYQTGHFGGLTQKALMKFQKKAGLAETGEVDDKTIWKINELLMFGAGRSGKIPPGLLRAPGIMKKLGIMPTTPPGGDTVVPFFVSLSATSTTASGTNIVWQTNELTTGVLHYATSTPVDSAFLPLISLDLVWQNNHRFTIANLSASTTYYYYLVAADYAGNRATSTTASFITLSQ